jgi:hypothetical protein
VNPAALPEGELAAADRADGDGAARLAVDTEGLGEALLAGPAADVEEVACGRVSFEVEEVQDAPGIDHGPGLDAPAGGLEDPDPHRRLSPAGRDTGCGQQAAAGNGAECPREAEA